jgi:serine/threonine protein phosphatase PrpC
MILSRADYFLVIASDSVWKKMTEDEVASIITPFYYENSAEKASEALMNECVKRW